MPEKKDTHLEVLYEQKEYYKALFLNSPVAVFTADSEGNVISWNPAAEELFGYSQKEAVGCPLVELVANDDSIREEAHNNIGRVLDLEPVRAISKRTRKDGSLVDVELLGVPVILSGELVGFTGIYHDISKQKAIQEELRSQKEYYEALFVNNPIAVITIDQNAHIISWNPEAEELFGYTQEEAIGRMIDDLVANDESVQAEAVGYTNMFLEDPDRLEDYGRLRITTKRTHKDGSFVDVEILGLPVVVGEERVGFIVIYHDISERIKYEEELTRQKEYYEALFIHTPVAVATVDREGMVISWNPSAERMFGYTQDEAVGKFVDDLVANNELVKDEALAYTQQLTSDTLEYTHFFSQRTRKDGSFVDVEAFGVPITIGEKHLGYIGLYHDITPLKNIEAELRREKEYFETLFVNSPVAVVTVDQNSVVVTWNQAAEKLFGYTHEEAVGRLLDDMVAKDATLHEEAVRYSQKAINREHIHATTKRTRKDGTLVDVELQSVPVIVSGEVSGYIAIYHDIGPIQDARRAAEAANKAKSDFLARMSHELRTPLNAIIGFTRLVKRKGADALPEKQLENLEKVLVSADHLLALINDILDLSKIEAGHMDVEPVRFDIEPLIDLCINTSQPLVNSGKVKLQKEVEKDLPGIFSDQNKVKQILLNLLSNASKFTHKGHITVKASRKADSLVLTVADTGIGISKEALEHIFEEFQQADMSTTRKYGGTGLGLSISQHLARLLGGQLVADSKEGKGSTFTLTLPFRYRGE